MEKSKSKSKSGFVHLFFLGVVIILFMVFSTLTSEAMNQKLIRKELEYKLKLDYATESYYLLLREGEILAEQGTSYGSLDIQALCRDKPENRYIQVDHGEETITITAWNQGKRRGEFEIKK